MKHINKLITLILCIGFCTSMLAQAPIFSSDPQEIRPHEMPTTRRNAQKRSLQQNQPPIFSKEMPEINPYEMPTRQKKANKFNPKPYQIPYQSKGQSYNVVTTEYPQIKNRPVVIQNNDGHSYYHSSGITENEIQNVTYNAPIEVHNAPLATSDHPPFEELSSNGMTRVSRDNTPNDPSVKVPIGDGIVPILIFALLWISNTLPSTKKE